MQPNNQALYTLSRSPREVHFVTSKGGFPLRPGQQIAGTDRAAGEQAMEDLPLPYTVPRPIAAVMSLETYPLNMAPGIDLSRVQRVADARYQSGMLAQPFGVRSMLG